ncbi:MAG: hypothetical protein NTX50_03445 [Candidatus Sumerlaeota bacterium]|nr:hypothetical protein [Candidatus Sumerlaeota bacterium]
MSAIAAFVAAVVICATAAHAQGTAKDAAADSQSTVSLTHMRGRNNDYQIIAPADFPSTLGSTLLRLAPDYVISQAAAHVQRTGLYDIVLSGPLRLGEAHLEYADGKVYGQITLPVKTEDVPTTRVVIEIHQPGNNSTRIFQYKWAEMPQYAASLFWYKSIFINGEADEWTVYWHDAQPQIYTLDKAKPMLIVWENIPPQELPESLRTRLNSTYGDATVTTVSRRTFADCGNNSPGDPQARRRQYWISLMSKTHTISVMTYYNGDIREQSRIQRYDYESPVEAAPGKPAAGAPPAGF